MLQRLLVPTNYRNWDLSNIRQQLTRKAKTAVVLTYMPVGLLTSVGQMPQLLPSYHAPQAAVLPITGGETQATDSATIVADHALTNIQKPFSGGILTTQYSWWHPGIDLAIAQGTPIQPILPGKVIEAQYEYSGYGNTIVIDHGNGYTSRYAHLSRINVKVGDAVTEDTIIGLVGSTGRSTGPHLHLEIAQNGATMNPLNVLPSDTVAQVDILAYTIN